MRIAIMIILLIVSSNVIAAGQICGGESTQECFAGEICSGGTCQPQVPQVSPSAGNDSRSGRPRGDSCVAISYSSSTGKVGYGLSTNPQIAAVKANRDCNRPKNNTPNTVDCRAVVQGKNTCVALAWDPHGAKDLYGVGSAKSEAIAKKTAIKRCGNARCVVGPWACASGH